MSDPKQTTGTVTIPDDQAPFFALHDEAMLRAGEADDALLRGDHIGAAKLYRLAAESERGALALVPTVKLRTWSIVVESAAALLFKSRQLAEAEQVLYLALARPDLTPYSFERLRDLLDTVRDEQALPTDTRYSDREITFTLAGKDVGSGTAPFDLVIARGSAVNKYLVRGAEYASQVPLRRAGGPKDEVSTLVQARVTQPTAGSFRFSVKLLEPAQLALPVEGMPPPPSAASIGDTLFGLAQAAVGGHASTERLAALVPDEGYRVTLLRLLREVAPTDKDRNRLEIAYSGGLGASSVPWERVELNPGTRPLLSAAIAAASPKTMIERDEKAKTRVMYGRLRAVDLEHKNLGLKTEAGEFVEITTDEYSVDDTIGPFVNKAVRATVLEVQEKRAVTRVLRDIELDDRSQSGPPAPVD